MLSLATDVNEVTAVNTDVIQDEDGIVLSIRFEE